MTSAIGCEGRGSRCPVRALPVAARSGRRACRGLRGFTLVEVILAVALAVGLIGTAMWFYRHAGEVRASVSASANDIAIRRHIMERMTTDLRNAVALPGQAGALDGATDRITFVTASLPGRTVWTPQSLTEAPPPAEQDLRQVSYGLQVYEDDYGVRHINGFEASVQKILSPKIIDEEQGQQVQNTLMSPQFRFVRFQFWDGTTWQIEWKEKPTPPLAVEIVLGETEWPEGEDPLLYSHAMTRRVVFLPSGAPTSEAGTVIQGLNGQGVGLP